MTHKNPLSDPSAWNLVAKGYSDMAPHMMGPCAEEARRILAPERDWRVLDVAAGTGVVSLAFAPHVREVQAVDFSENMLKQLRKNLAAADVQNVTIQQADGQALPFENQTFDAALSMFGLMFFPDRVQGFRELLRTLKPGGGSVVSSWAPVAGSPLMQAVFGAARVLKPDLPPPQTNLLSLENLEVLQKEMQDAGFVDVEVTPFTVAPPLSDDMDEVWEHMVGSSAPLALLKQSLGPVWKEREPHAKAFLAERIQSATAALTSTALLAHGRRPHA